VNLSSDFTRGARGDHDAQAEMVKFFCVLADNGKYPPALAMLLAEVWARMAAVSGKVEHRASLAGVLFGRCTLSAGSQVDEERIMLSEAMQLLDGCANDGCENAAVAMTVYAEFIPAEVLADASALCASKKKHDDARNNETLEAN
jgi:hypothetical protein